MAKKIRVAAAFTAMLYGSTALAQAAAPPPPNAAPNSSAAAKTEQPKADRDSAAEEIVVDRKSTRLNSSHLRLSRMPSSA